MNEMQTAEDTTFNQYQKMLQEVRAMASGVGQAKGRIFQARRMLLRLATKRFGPPEAAVLAVLEDIRDIDRLEALSDRILDADVLDWNRLLGLA